MAAEIMLRTLGWRDHDATVPSDEQRHKRDDPDGDTPRSHVTCALTR